MVSEVKHIIRNGWNDKEVVESYINNTTIGLFEEPGYRRAWLSVLAGTVQRVTRLKVLDVGCGPGTIAMLWSELNHTVCGLDFSRQMLEAAGKIIKQKKAGVSLIEGDAEFLPFDNESFDVVSGRLVLFTLQHPGHAVREWRRVLKPGGVMVIIGEEALASAPGRIVRWWERLASFSESNRYGKYSWQPPAECDAAINHLPLRADRQEIIRVLMEAAGIDNITSIDMAEIIAERQGLSDSVPCLKDYKWLKPYILVGWK